MLRPLSRLESLLFEPLPAAAGRTLGLAQLALRYAYALARDLVVGDLNMRAMSLVYTTLLSIVPLFAFSFAIVKGLGFHRAFAPLLDEFFRPLGARAGELTTQVLDYVDRMQGGVLGSLGLVFLVFAVLSIINKLEESVNRLWRVDRTRSFGRRIGEYLAVLLAAPLLMVAALGLVASLSTQALIVWLGAHEPFGTVLVMLGRTGPLLVVSTGFAFLYAFVPNTRVRPRVAIGAGLAAGAAWVAASFGFAGLVAYSTQMMAVYASFAIALLTLMWLWLNWLILLTGALFGFYLQHPEYLRSGERELQPTPRLRERLALSALILIGRAFEAGGQRPAIADLADALAVPANALGPVIEVLAAAGLVATGAGEGLLPGRDPAQITIAAVYAAVRDGSCGRGLTLREARLVDVAERVADELEAALAAHLGRTTLAELLGR